MMKYWILTQQLLQVLDSIYVNRDPIYDTELSTKQYTDNLFNESIVK